MNGWAYCEFRDGRPVFTGLSGDRDDATADLTGGSAAVTADNFDAVLLSRLDVLFTVLEVPKLPDKELRSAIGFRIRGVYPGTPERTSFDFTTARNGGRAAVTILPTDRLNAILDAAAGRPLFLPWHILKNDPRFSDPKGAAAAFVGRGWIEFLLLDGAGPRESKVLPRSTPDADGAKIAEFLSATDEKRRAFCVASRNELDVLKTSVPKADPGAAVEYVELETLLRSGSRTSLFRPERKAKIPPFAVRLPILLALLSASILAGYSGTVSRLEEEAGTLAGRYAGLENRLRDTVELEREIEVLEAELASYAANEAPDPYGFFRSLRDVFGTGVRIDSLSLNGRTFRCEGRSVNPFALAGRFATSNGLFSNIRIARVSPLPGTDEESFILSGTYHGR